MNSHGQKTKTKTIEFVSYENQLFGFDAYLISDWKEDYLVSIVGDSNDYQVAYKSVAEGFADSVNLVLSKSIQFAELTFKIANSRYEIEYLKRSKGVYTLVLPMKNKSYSLDVYKEDKLLASLSVVVYPMTTVEVIVVPLIRFNLNSDSLEVYLNKVYGQAGVNISIEVKPYFKTEEFTDSILSNPNLDRDRFTDQMVEIRNEYFDAYQSGNQKAYYIFLVNGFVDKTLQGYSVRNKAVSFVKSNADDLHRVIANQLGYGIGALKDFWEDDGPEMGTTKNLMDLKGTILTYPQWEAIRSMHKMISYYDDYEDVRTNNGLIAYYLWEEDADGNIILSSGGFKKSIVRPFKRNTYSLFLDIDNFLFIQLFNVLNYPICFLHIFGMLLFGFLSVFLRRKIVKWSDRIRRNRFLRLGNRLVVFAVFFSSYVGLFVLINEGYFLYEVQLGELKNLEGMNVRTASKEVEMNRNQRRSQEKDPGSEILVKRGNKWILDKRKKVLYFSLKKNEKGELKCKLSNDSDSLILKTNQFKKVANSHYFVFSYVDDKGKYIKQEAFNHLGVNITEKLKLRNPAKRILLFVNGYRSTSIGNSFEENFYDVLNHGLEFQNSRNIIYSFDRYSYWEPWNEMNKRFEQRLNPSESYYADGHHSVATSNHRSLINFTTLLSTYPKRCQNPKHHVCKKSQKGWPIIGLSREVNTIELMNLSPNKKGFKERKENGEVAGRNLFQIFNELPNLSQNDTLYIVSHSMGYAYTLGIIEKLRGKINFGGLYIIAPENASAGDVNPKEWKEIWQYGSDFEANRLSAPCLLDGIAPQIKVGGLSPRQRAYIPEKEYTKMGFFNSHFIGHYTWIFDLNNDESGYIIQR